MIKKLIYIVLTITVIITVYFLLEPIFVHNIGKKPLPRPNLEVAVEYDSVAQLEADSILKESYSALKTPALSVAVSIDGTIQWNNAIGYADLESRTKAQLNTMFRTGSTSKAITSVGLGVMLQSKQLTLNTKVSELLPDANKNIKELTVKQLASHTSGIRNYGICFCFPVWEYLNTKQYEDVNDAVNIFEDDPLLFEPDSNFSYSTYNFTLLSALMQKAAQQPYSKYMIDRVFTPLNLERTIPENRGFLVPTMAKLYDLDNGNYTESFSVNNSNKIAGGGFLSTPTDLVKLGNAMLDLSLFSEKVKNLLIEPVKLTNGEVNEQNYALGWRNSVTDKMFNGEREIRVIHHGGMAKGSTSLLVLFPEYKMSIAILMNRSSESFNLFDYAYRFAEFYIPKIENGEFKNDKMHSQNAESAQ